MREHPATPHSVWSDFKYRVFHKDPVDGRIEARRIKSALASTKTPRMIAAEIEQGITLMMLAAGLQLAPGVPWDVRYLAAHQHLQNYYGGLTLLTPAEVERVGALIRAMHVVTAALDRLKRPEVQTAERLAAFIEAPETPRVVRELLRHVATTIDTFSAPPLEKVHPLTQDYAFQFGPAGLPTPSAIRRKLPAMLRRIGHWRLAYTQPHELCEPDEKGGGQ